MTEQLYRIERRRAKRGEDYRARAETDTVMEVHVLVPVEPTPGTLEWARGIVRDGGAVWYGSCPMTKHCKAGIVYPTGKTEGQLMVAEFGWRLWGDREWLRVLPGGTKVVGPKTAAVYMKTSKGLEIEDNLHGIPPLRLDAIYSSGWDLVREPVKAMPTPILDQDDDDDTIADLVRRVEVLERKAGNP